MRVSRKEGSQLVWEDQVWRIPKPSGPIRTAIDLHLLESLKQISSGRLDLEADFLLSPASIGKRGQRPLAVYTLMIADHDSGFIFGFDVMRGRFTIRDARTNSKRRCEDTFAKPNRAAPADRTFGQVAKFAEASGAKSEYRFAILGRIGQHRSGCGVSR